jgi:hypothetical protein
VLYEHTGVVVTNEEEAKYVVRLYLEENDLEYEIGTCIKLNSVSFNVFASDKYGDEVTYTVAADGTIIKKDLRCLEMIGTGQEFLLGCDIYSQVPEKK